MTALPTIVLVHGAWADGSSWSAVIEHLQADGYSVTAPQFPMTTLADNRLYATKRGWRPAVLRRGQSVTPNTAAGDRDVWRRW